jgi:hypothetical protein
MTGSREDLYRGRLVGVLLLSVALGCAARKPAEAPADFALAQRLGVAQIARDMAYCLTIVDSALAMGAPLLLVSLGPVPRVDSARVEARRDEPCTRPGDEWGAVIAEGAAWYDLQLVIGAEPVIPAVAILGPAGPLVVRDSTVAGDLDGDGREERFQLCASAEGLHLSVVTPTDRGPQSRWHQYFYLPYDIEPNCPATEP